MTTNKRFRAMIDNVLHCLRKDVESLEEENKTLKKQVDDLNFEYNRVNNILEDFMMITNRLQANPNDAQSQSVARDMLMMMGKEVIK